MSETWTDIGSLARRIVGAAGKESDSPVATRWQGRAASVSAAMGKEKAGLRLVTVAGSYVWGDCERTRINPTGSAATGGGVAAKMLGYREKRPGSLSARRRN